MSLLYPVTPADVRRVLSRVAGPALLTLPVWCCGHAGGGLGAWALSGAAAWLWFAAALALGLWWGGVRKIARLLAYDCAAPVAIDQKKSKRAIKTESPFKSGRWLLELLAVLLYLGFVAAQS